MPRFINHDAIAEGLLNLGYGSGSGAHNSWKSELQNSLPVLQYMLSRMELDWVALAPKMRRPWNLTTLAT